MKRRNFVKSSIIAGTVAGTIPALANAMDNNVQKKTNREFYELRTYLLKDEKQQKLVEDYFKIAAIPAFSRLGVKHTGVFTELKPDGQTKLYVLIPFKSMEDFVNLPIKLNKDKEYLEKASSYLNAPASEPAYERIESILLHAFTHMPQLEAPEKNPRIFELRRYESASESGSKKKIEMFNEGGEINIFRKTGLTPVFFGECLIGDHRPHLTYMIAFKDMEEHDKNWKTFVESPEWKKISSMPEYADSKIISKITATFLVPTGFSQI